MPTASLPKAQSKIGVPRANIADILLVFGLALQPVYAWSSGLPQISDILFAIFALSVALKYRQIRVPARILYLYIALVGLVSVVNISWGAALGETRMIQVSLFYIFNCVLTFSLLTYLWFERRRGLKTIALGLALGLAVSTLLLISGLNFGGARQTAGFNNPNQLAYYGVLIVAIITFINQRIRMAPLQYWLIVGVATVIGLFGSSLVGIVASLVMLTGIALFEVKRPITVIIVISALILVIPLFLQTEIGAQLSSQISSRQTRAGTKIESTVKERGFLRIIEYPLLSVVGAGEGATYRFRAGLENELHSSPLTMLFSYGMLGFILYLLLMSYGVRGLPFSLLLVYLGPHIYSMTHQGLRFSLFWVFMSVYFFFVSTKPQRNNVSF